MPKSLLIRLLCIALFCVLTVYCLWSWFFQTGLYAFLIRFQANTFDAYFPLLTAVGMWAVVALIPLAYAFGGKKRHEYQLKYHELERHLKSRTRWLALWLLIFASLASAAYYLSIDAPADDQEIIGIDLADFHQQSLWFKKVSLKGTALTDSSTVTEESRTLGGQYFARYTPIVTSAKSEQPVRFIEAFYSDSIERISAEPVSLTGFVIPTALPVLIQDSLKKDGLILADRTYLIGNHVFNAKTSLYIAAAVSALICFFLLVGLIVSPFHNQRKLKECKEHQGRW